MYLAVLPELVLIQYLLVDDINVTWFSSGAVEFSLQTTIYTRLVPIWYPVPVRFAETLRLLIYRADPL